ncbi:MAG: PAS domain S-box protein [Melioribacter sp.]|nr:PAS domain S-box protein [Melioribacter sp.]
MLDHENPSRIPWALLFAFLAITIIISITGLYIYNAQKAEIKSDIYSELAFISKSKLEQVTEWKNNRLSDAYKIEEDQSFIYDFQKWLSNKNEKGLKQRIEKFIDVIKQDSNYTNVYLIDGKFNVCFAWNENEKISQVAQKNLIIVSKTKKILLSDLHRTETYSPIHLDLIIPLVLLSERHENLIGLILIRIIPDKYLYSIIQSWPTASKSAETYLIRREQDHVLYLSELRHKKNTALSLTDPLSDTLLTAVKAALGYNGIFEGIDYRGIKVLADICQIPGTNWAMVTKVDVEEIYSPLRERALLIFLFAMALIVIAFVSSVLVWRHQRSVFYREKYRLETERKAMEKHFAYLIKNANDIILLLNEGGKIVEANDRAISAYGYTQDELLELNIKDIRSEETMELITRDMEEVRIKGGVILETMHRRKDGTTFSVEVSSLTIEIENAVYYQSIIRDITERKQAEEKLERLNRLYAFLSQINQAIVRANEREKLFYEICEIAIQFGKFNIAWFGLVDYEKKSINIVASFPNKNETIKNSVVNYTDETSEVLIFAEALNTQCVTVNNEIPSGRSLSDSIVESQDLHFRSVAVLPIKFENKVVGVFTVYSSEANYFHEEEIRLLDEVGLDISFALENIKAKEILRESEIRLKNLFDNSPIGIVMLDDLDRIISINREFEKIFHFTLEEIKGLNINEIIAPDQLINEAVSLSIKSLSGEVVQKESIRKRKDGSLINVEIFGVPIIVDKKQIGIYGMYIDITKRKIAEEEIVKSVSLLQATFESTADGLLVVDAEGRIVQFNRRFAELWHIPEEILATKDDNKALAFVIDQLKYPDVFLAKVKELYNQHEATSFDLLEFKDGRVFERYSQPQRMERKSVGRVWSFRDITERKKAELELIESEEKFRSFAEESPNMIFINKAGRVVYINKKCVEVMGYTREEFLDPHFNFLDLIAPEYVETVKENFANRYKGKAKDSYEYALITKDRKRIEVTIAATIINFEGVNAILGNVTDITERKLADEEIRKLYRGVEQSPATVVITDRQGNIEYVNNKFCETSGYTFAEVIGKNPRILKSGEKTKEEYELLWKTVLSGDEWRGEFHNKKKNGELYWEFASLSPIKNEKDEITHFIAIKEDITDRKRMIEELMLAKDKAEKSERVKTEFLEQMSHEIRTPINIILGFNSFIKEELKKNITEELSESFDSIESASKRIMRTVDMILNMSEIQTGTVTASHKDLDISEEVLSTLYMEYKQQAERKNLSFIYSVMTGDTKVFADDYLATHIFTNLIDNAVKYTEKGRIEIVINRNDQNKLYVEVKDTGIGISEEFIPKLFDAFTQEEHGYSRKYEGNGLGLALVKKYCELNNAQIEVESTKGVGSVFRVIFN